MKNYRLCITCPAKHITYDDYKTLKSAIKNLANMQDKTDWHLRGMFKYFTKK